MRLPIGQRAFDDMLVERIRQRVSSTGFLFLIPWDHSLDVLSSLTTFPVPTRFVEQIDKVKAANL